MSERKTRRTGFTLVELMIVVAIISVLAVVAGSAYRRYMDAGRSAEVFAMMGEFRNKEEAYRAEFSSYLSTGADETSASVYPQLLGKGQEPRAKTVAALPLPWQQLGINPGRSMLYCGYVAMAGAAGTAPAGTRGATIFNNATPTTPWWYLVATCDNDSDGNSAHNAYFTTSSATTVVVTENEHW